MAKISKNDIAQVKAIGCLHDKNSDDLFNCCVITRNGKITAKECAAIAEAAEKFGSGEVTMTTRMTMEIQGVPFENIQPLRSFLAEFGLETGGTGAKVRPIVSCKGTTCQYGLIDTYDLSMAIHNHFYKGYSNVSLPHKFKIAVGGCPNNCVKPDLNDIGIVGQRKPIIDYTKCRGCKVCQIEKTCPINASFLKNGVITFDSDICNSCGRCVNKCPFKAYEDYIDSYKIYIGGRWGKQFARAKALSCNAASSEEVLDIIEKAILLFRENGFKGERFADTVKRIGFENVEKQLLSGDILKRKDEIIAMEISEKNNNPARHLSGFCFIHSSKPRCLFHKKCHCD